MGMQNQPQVVQPVEGLLLAITPTAHPPRWVLQEQQPPMMLASSVDKQAIGREIVQVGTFAHVVLQYIVASAAAICIRPEICCCCCLQHHGIVTVKIRQVLHLFMCRHFCISCYSAYMAADSVDVLGGAGKTLVSYTYAWMATL